MMALVIAMVMMVAMATMVFATTDDNDDSDGGGTTPATEAALADGSIKITPPSGLDDAASNTYIIYKVFNATNNGTAIAYTIDSTNGDLTQAMTAAGFSVDTAGNVSGPASLDATAIAAIAAYATHQVASVTATGTDPVTASGLGAGYYYITTTTGTVVTIDSTNPSANVIDKNTVPSVDKTITGANSVDEDGKKALAQVGTTVNYSAEITVGDGAKGYVFHDTMETGLTYNNDAAVTGVTAGTSTYAVTKVGDDTFTIQFADDYIKTLSVGNKITITYSAVVNDAAITTDPLNNTCYVSYGDANSNNKTPSSEADVYEAKFTVTKQDGEGAPLAGAGFVIANAAGKYYSITGTTVSWVDSIDNATEYTSGDDGAVQSFTGLANGTYTLIEKTVPAGYNKADDREFTIAEHNYQASNLEQASTVTNNAGQELPSTGGIGTTIFYIVGAILVLGAGILLVTRRRMNAN